MRPEDALDAHLERCERKYEQMKKLSERIRKKQDYEPPLQASEVLLRDTCGQWADEVAQLEAELKRLRGFWDALCMHMFECWELDGGDFLDMGEKFGLLVNEIYDPEGKHKDMIVMDVELGDECWFNVYALKAGGRG